MNSYRLLSDFQACPENVKRFLDDVSKTDTSMIISEARGLINAMLTAQAKQPQQTFVSYWIPVMRLLVQHSDARTLVMDGLACCSNKDQQHHEDCGNTILVSRLSPEPTGTVNTETRGPAYIHEIKRSFFWAEYTGILEILPLNTYTNSKDLSGSTAVTIPVLVLEASQNVTVFYDHLAQTMRRRLSFHSGMETQPLLGMHVVESSAACTLYVSWFEEGNDQVVNIAPTDITFHLSEEEELLKFFAFLTQLPRTFEPLARDDTDEDDVDNDAIPDTKPYMIGYEMVPFRCWIADRGVQRFPLLWHEVTKICNRFREVAQATLPVADELAVYTAIMKDTTPDTEAALKLSAKSDDVRVANTLINTSLVDDALTQLLTSSREQLDFWSAEQQVQLTSVGLASSYVRYSGDRGCSQQFAKQDWNRMLNLTQTYQDNCGGAHASVTSEILFNTAIRSASNQRVQAMQDSGDDFGYKSLKDAITAFQETLKQVHHALMGRDLNHPWPADLKPIDCNNTCAAIQADYEVWVATYRLAEPISSLCLRKSMQDLEKTKREPTSIFCDALFVTYVADVIPPHRVDWFAENGLLLDSISHSSKDHSNDLLLPSLVCVFRRPCESVQSAGKRARMAVISAVKYLASIGVVERLVYGLLTDGARATVIAGIQTAAGVAKLFDLEARVYDVWRPKEAQLLFQALLRIRTKSEEVEYIELVRRSFEIWRNTPDSQLSTWTFEAQLPGITEMQSQMDRRLRSGVAPLYAEALAWVK